MGCFKVDDDVARSTNTSKTPAIKRTRSHYGIQTPFSAQKQSTWVVDHCRIKRRLGVHEDFLWIYTPVTPSRYFVCNLQGGCQEAKTEKEIARPTACLIGTHWQTRFRDDPEKDFAKLARLGPDLCFFHHPGLPRNDGAGSGRLDGFVLRARHERKNRNPKGLHIGIRSGRLPWSMASLVDLKAVRRSPLRILIESREHEKGLADSRACLRLRIASPQNADELGRVPFFFSTPTGSGSVVKTYPQGQYIHSRTQTENSKAKTSYYSRQN